MPLLRGGRAALFWKMSMWTIMSSSLKSNARIVQNAAQPQGVPAAAGLPGVKVSLSWKRTPMLQLRPHGTGGRSAGK